MRWELLISVSRHPHPKSEGVSTEVLGDAPGAEARPWGGGGGGGGGGGMRDPTAAAAQLPPPPGAPRNGGPSARGEFGKKTQTLDFIRFDPRSTEHVERDSLSLLV